MRRLTLTKDTPIATNALPTANETRALLIWDGSCGFCRNAVDWLIQHDGADRLNPVPYQDLPTPPMTPALRQQAEHAVQVITSQGQQLSGGRAVLYALQVVGWRPALVRLAQRRPLVWGVELGYWIVARNRDRFSRVFFRAGSPARCTSR
ncbi:MAG: DCC1-like thiol-disulfide oxidoreductase family protein [Thermomicrobiales bacterium]